MSGPVRLWIAVLVATSFLAGLAAGLLGGLRLAPAPPDRGPFADYETLLVEQFDLSPERQRGLRYLMDEYHRRLERLKTRNIDVLEPELVRLGLTFRGRVRDTVLPPSRRTEFDLLAEGASPFPLQ